MPCKNLPLFKTLLSVRFPPPLKFNGAPLPSLQVHWTLLWTRVFTPPTTAGRVVCCVLNLALAESALGGPIGYFHQSVFHQNCLSTHLTIPVFSTNGFKQSFQRSGNLLKAPKHYFHRSGNVFKCLNHSFFNRVNPLPSNSSISRLNTLSHS